MLYWGKLPLCAYAILEAVTRDEHGVGRMASRRLASTSGYAYQTVLTVCAALRHYGLMKRYEYTLTERGKIALALWHGRQYRKRRSKKMAA